MTAVRKKRLLYFVGIVISIFLMVMLFWNIEYAKLADALKGANYYWLIPNIVLVVVTMYVRGYRWLFMIKPIKSVSFSKLFSATCIGFMANNVLPLRLGEFVRAYSLSYQDKDISKSASMATIFVERMVFDLVALLLIFGAVVSVSTVHIPDEMKAGIYLAITVALAGLIFVMTLALKPSQSGEILTRYLFFLPDRIKEIIKTIVVKFSRGLEFMTDMKMVSNVSLYTLLIWLCLGVSNFFVFQAFDFNLSLEASFFLLVVVSVSILVPSSPGFVGVYHAGTVFTLSQYGIGREDALSFALVLHAAQYIPVTLMGFYFLKKEHLSLKQLEEEASDESEE